jgi:hypothetical protein
MIPELAQRKLAALAQATEDSLALAHAAKKKVADAERQLQLRINAHLGEADLSRAAAEVEAAQDLMQARHRVYEGREQLVTRLKSWLRELPRDTVLEPVPAPVVALNGAPAHVVGTLRSEIAKLVVQHHAVRTASAPLDDAKRQVRELVETLGRRGAPRLTTQGGTLQVHGWSSDQTTGPVPIAALVEFAAWFDPDTMISRLDEMLERQPASGDALPLSERASRLAEIEAEIAILEHREEAIIERAHRDGVVIERRHDQSPQSILGVRIATAAARAAA